MPERTVDDVESRVSRVEERLTGIERGVSALAGSIERLGGEFAAARRPQWQLLVSVLGIMIALGTAAGSIIMLAQRGALAPLQTQVAAQAKALEEQGGRLGRVQDKAEETARLLAEQIEHSQEVETQFKALSNYSALSAYEADRFVRLLWRRTYQEDLPPLAERPTVGNGP